MDGIELYHSVHLDSFQFSDAHAQCPPSYTLVGGRCLWFMPSVMHTYEQANEICFYYGGTMPKIDDCNLLGEVVKYMEANSK